MADDNFMRIYDKLEEIQATIANVGTSHAVLAHEVETVNKTVQDHLDSHRWLYKQLIIWIASTLIGSGGVIYAILKLNNVLGK